MTRKRQIITLAIGIVALLMAVSSYLIITSCSIIITPIDSPHIPDRGFFKGFASILPSDENFEDLYEKVSEHAEFVNIWVSAGVDYWNLAEYLAGWWSNKFVDDLVRENEMFPIINLSFIDKDPETGLLILKVPEDKEYTSLSDSDFRKTYKQAALDTAKVSKSLYLSVGNGVNRWYEQYGAGDNDSNGFSTLSACMKKSTMQ